MDTDKLKTLAARLEEERTALLGAHARLEQDLRSSRTSEDTAGPDFAADQEEEEIEAKIVESEERLLEKINHALVRIEEGTYGICESCEAPIAEARLEAKPSVSLCIDCQESRENAAG